MNLARQLLLYILLVLFISACSWVKEIITGAEAEVTAIVEDTEKAMCTVLDAAQCYAEGQQLLTKKDSLTDAMALVFFIQACDKGSAEACEQAATMYQVGKGTGQDAVQAVKRFVQACNIDKTSGCYDAALAYQDGSVVKKDLEKAAEYFTDSCDNAAATDNNKGPACTQKGLILLGQAAKDKKVVQALYQAFDFFQKACKTANGEGCFQLAESYRRGRGVAGSEEYALQYYVLGCNGAFAESCLWAGKLNDGNNPKQATQYYYTGCSYNNAEACFELAERYRLGKAIKKNLALAQLTYQQICAKTLPVACYWQAQLLQQQLKASAEKPDDKKIVGLLKAYGTACTAKVALACYQLAVITQKAEWVTADPPAVAQFLATHCNEQQWLGCYDLALLYESGNGVVRDLQRTADLFKQVCEADAHNTITDQLQMQAEQLAKDKQWQLLACWQLAQLLWEYPAKPPKKDSTTQNNTTQFSTTQFSTTQDNTIQDSKPLAKDNKTALIYFDKACQLHWLPACLAYAIALDRGIAIDKNPVGAFTYYSSACALDQVATLKATDTRQVDSTTVTADIGEQTLPIRIQRKTVADACYNLAVNYRDGIGIEKSEPVANVLFKQSCQLKQAWACYNYALSLDDTDQALWYFQQSCELGLANACLLIGRHP